MKEIKEQSEDFMKVHFHNKSNIPIMSGFVDEITNLMVDFYLSRPIESHSDQLIDIMNSEVSDDEIIKSTSDYCTVSHLDELVFDTDEFVKWYRTHAKEPSIDLDELERRLDEALANETPETLKAWLKEQRESEHAQEPQVYCKDCDLPLFLGKDSIHPVCECITFGKQPNTQKPQLTEAKVDSLLNLIDRERGGNLLQLKAIIMTIEDTLKELTAPKRED